jgi:hypothetical protein
MLINSIITQRANGRAATGSDTFIDPLAILFGGHDGELRFMPALPGVAEYFETSIAETKAMPIS